MKYYIDTEFLEGTQKENFPISLFRKNTPPTIDLISIGIVAEDGREYYAISKDFNLKEAWNRFDGIIPMTNLRGDSGASSRKNYWIRENVLKPIYYELIGKDINFHDYDNFFTYKAMKNLISKYGKTNKEIASEIKNFCHFWNTLDTGRSLQNHPIEFYAYYADYDWVAFCWLFGKMMDLPKGFPMYCRDLKQILDEYALNAKFANGSIQGANLENRLTWIKSESDYPKQENEHNALADARWNKKLHEFLNSI